MSALYERLKKRKVLKTCPERIYEKLRKQFWDTQRVPFMLYTTRNPLFIQLERFLWKKSEFFLSEDVA